MPSALPPLRIAEMLTPAPFPVPEVTSRDPWPSDFITPAPVLKLNQDALENGWQTKLQYARGYPQHAVHGTALGLYHLVAIRFGAHPMTRVQAYAIYRSPVAKKAWTWSDTAIWGPDITPFVLCTVTQLKEILLGGQFDIPALRDRLTRIRRERYQALQGKLLVVCPGAPACSVTAKHTHTVAGKVTITKARSGAS